VLDITSKDVRRNARKIFGGITSNKVQTATVYSFDKTLVMYCYRSGHD